MAAGCLIGFTFIAVAHGMFGRFLSAQPLSTTAAQKRRAKDEREVERLSINGHLTGFSP
jgi:hypothetical protein